MADLDLLKEIIKKTDITSVLISFFSLGCGIILILSSGDMGQPKAIAGMFLIVIGLVMAVGSWLFTNIKEHYENIINGYKDQIKVIHGSYKKLDSHQTETNLIKSQDVLTSKYTTISFNSTSDS